MKQVNKKSKGVSKKPKSARKEASKKPKSASKAPGVVSGLATTEFPSNVRFSATIHVRDVTDPSWFERLAIDRVPDPTGAIRALVTPADCVRLVNEGFEVRLDAAYPVQPLDPALIESKDSFQRWLDERIQTTKRVK